MSLYLGSGFRCQVSGACGFRVMPASGDDQDLDEAARVRRAHERTCRMRGVAEPIKTKAQTIDDIRTDLATQRLELDDPTPKHWRPPKPRETKPYRRGPNGNTGAYNREPTGRGWRRVIAEYARAHPGTTAREVAVALRCRPSTATTYLGMYRDGERAS